MNKKRKWYLLIIFLLCVFFSLWFSGLLPKQVAKIVADSYMEKAENIYEFSSIEYSAAHDSYFATYFSQENSENKRSVEIPYKYFPFKAFSDSNDWIDK